MELDGVLKYEEKRARDALGKEHLQQLELAARDYRNYYLTAKLTKAAEVKGFNPFLEDKKYGTLRAGLETACKNLGYAWREIVYYALPEKWRKILPKECAVEHSGYSDDEDAVKQQVKDVFDRALLRDPVVAGFRDIQEHLTDAQRERLATGVAGYLLEKYKSTFTPDEKEALTTERIRRRILNLGFITLPRTGNRQVFGFIVNYPALFKNEQEVLEAILERHIDYELAHAPKVETNETVARLKREISAIYEKVMRNES